MSESKIIAREELAKHTELSSLWIVVHGRVYDVTPYLAKHPGGISHLLRSGGTSQTHLNIINTSQRFKMVKKAV